MVISKEAILESVQDLSDKFTLNELRYKLFLFKKLEPQKTGVDAVKKKIPQFGSMKGLAVYIAPDFNEPLL